MEPNIFPKSVINTSIFGLEPVDIRLNPIRSNRKHTSQIQHYVKYSFELLGLNHIKLKLTVPLSYSQNYLQDRDAKRNSEHHNGNTIAYVYIKLPNEQWIELSYSEIINDLIEWTESNDIDIDDGYYHLPGMGLNSNNGIVGDMYIQFSIDTLRYAKGIEAMVRDVNPINQHADLIKLSHKNYNQFCFRKNVERKAYQEKQEYFMSQKITYVDGVSVIPVV